MLLLLRQLCYERLVLRPGLELSNIQLLHKNISIILAVNLLLHVRLWNPSYRWVKIRCFRNQSLSCPSSPILHPFFSLFLLLLFSLLSSESTLKFIFSVRPSVTLLRKCDFHCYYLNCDDDPSICRSYHKRQFYDDFKVS